MFLPQAPDVGLLLVRTDYSDDAAWHTALDAATAVYEDDDFPRIGALLQAVESPLLAGLTPWELIDLPREGFLGELAVADTQTMEDRTVLFSTSTSSAPRWGVVVDPAGWVAPPAL